MASPHVAGVAALVLSSNASLTGDQVGNIIRSTARPLRDDPSDPVPNDWYGSGLVQAGGAVGAVASGSDGAGPRTLRAPVPRSACATELTSCPAVIPTTTRIG